MSLALYVSMYCFMYSHIAANAGTRGSFLVSPTLLTPFTTSAICRVLPTRFGTGIPCEFSLLQLLTSSLLHLPVLFFVPWSFPSIFLMVLHVCFETQTELRSLHPTPLPLVPVANKIKNSFLLYIKAKH